MNPAELLGSQGMRQVLVSLSQMADVVICDSPPALGLTDADILANRADGVVLVIEAGQTRLDAARQAISDLQQADANLLGAVLNRVPKEGHLPYYSGPLTSSFGINWQLIARASVLVAVGILLALIYLAGDDPMIKRMATLTSSLPPPTRVPPTPTAMPTRPFSDTAMSTPTVVARFGNQVRTGKWAVTIFGAKRAEWLPWNDRRLEPAGQWLIVYGEAQNLTTQQVTLYTHDFRLIMPSLKGEIDVHGDATAAANLLFDVDKTVAGFSGMDIQPGQTETLIVAFDTPKIVKEATLQIVDAGVGVGLGPEAQMEILPLGSPQARR